jgi:hypothetical protein
MQATDDPIGATVAIRILNFARKPLTGALARKPDNRPMPFQPSAA